MHPTAQLQESSQLPLKMAKSDWWPSTHTHYRVPSGIIICTTRDSWQYLKDSNPGSTFWKVHLQPSTWEWTIRTWRPSPPPKSLPDDNAGGLVSYHSPTLVS